MNKQDIQEFNSKFEQITHKKIIPILQDFEEDRKNVFAIFIICVITLVVFLFIETIFMYIKFGIACPIISLICSLFYIFYISQKNQKFSMTLKEKCLRKMLNIFGKMEWHSWKEKIESSKWITDSSLNKSGLFIPFNRRQTDDEFKGSFKGVDFQISETDMFDIHGSGKNRTCIPVFKGIVIQFKCNKTIKNRTIVSTKGDFTRKSVIFTMLLPLALVSIKLSIKLFKHGFDWFSAIIFLLALGISLYYGWSMLSKEEKLDKVLLEDIKFNKRFNIYSSDQVEARYLLTPSFMERLYYLQTTFGTNKIKCSFFDDSLMIAIHTNKNLFELGDLFHSLLKTKSYKKLYNDLLSILIMIDYFKLDENTKL